MAAIKEGIERVVNYVMDTIMGGSEDTEPFGALAGEEDDGYMDYPVEDNLAVEPKYTPVEPKRETKVVNLPSSNRGGNEVVIVEPHSFDDAATIVQHLKDRKIVMLNLHLLDKEQSQRTIDFVCGAAQALNGSPKKVGDLVFVFAPSNVTLSADFQAQPNKFNDSIWGTSFQ